VTERRGLAHGPPTLCCAAAGSIEVCQQCILLCLGIECALRASVRRDFRGHADSRRECAQGQRRLRCHRTCHRTSPISLLQLHLAAVHLQPRRLCTDRRHLSGPDCLEVDRGDVQPRRGEHLILSRCTAAVVIHSKVTTAGAGDGECGRTGQRTSTGIGRVLSDFWPRAKSTFLVPVALCCILLLSQRCSTGLLAFALILLPIRSAARVPSKRGFHAHEVYVRCMQAVQQLELLIRAARHRASTPMARAFPGRR